jgi:hypothetical protein
MSAYGMKPKFTNWIGYQTWLAEWRTVYEVISTTNRSRKHEIKNNLRLGQSTKKLYEKYSYEKVMATKMITLRNEAVIRWRNIKKMYASVQQQHSTFPIIIENAKNIDFYFNKKHLEFPKMPMWLIRAKGISYAIWHVDCEIPWSTKEKLDDVSTKGMIRIKHGNVYIDSDGCANITAIK